MVESIKIKKYNKNEVKKINKEIKNFINNLNDEKITLYGDVNLEIFKLDVDKLLENTIILVIVLKDEKIVGLAGIRKLYGGFVSKILPIVRGYTVVKKEYQGKGIGSAMVLERDVSMKKIYAFHLSIIVKDNLPMIRIVEKSGYKLIGIIDNYIYHVKTFNNFMEFFTPIIVIIYKIKLRLTKRPV